MCTQFTQRQENGIFTYCDPYKLVYVVLTPPISQLHVNITLEMSTVVEMWQNETWIHNVISTYPVHLISTHLAHVCSIHSWIDHITLLSTTIGSRIHKIVFDLAMEHFCLKSVRFYSQSVQIGRMYEN